MIISAVAFQGRYFNTNMEGKLGMDYQQIYQEFQQVKHLQEYREYTLYADQQQKEGLCPDDGESECGNQWYGTWNGSASRQKSSVIRELKPENPCWIIMGRHLPECIRLMMVSLKWFI